MRTIRSSLLTLIAGLIIFQSSEAMTAVYNFNVKVINNSGQDIELRHIRYKAKGNPGKKNCGWDEQVLVSDGSSTLEPRCRASYQKWRRQIELNIKCKSSGVSRNLCFPRGSKKFFARDHAQKNGDKYVTKIKAGDC